MAKYKVLMDFSTSNDGKSYSKNQEVDFKVADADTINGQAEELHGKLFLERVEETDKVPSKK